MKKNSRHSKKIRNLVVICALCAILLTVSTYAWFIGMKTVNVSSFDVEIATTEGLYLSMDGSSWHYTLDAKNATAYTGNTNTWADPTDSIDDGNDGLIPVSSIGDMDASVSRMKLFEKKSLTTTPGGYRLLTSRVHNFNIKDTNLEQGEGYVAFDLFIKNISGAEYYESNEPLNEEAIYLTTNSKVEVATANGGNAGTGIENSVRVAFAQIGRVVGTTTTAGDITGITCSNAAVAEHAKVTGICRNAQIWEPNDTAHVQNAINWYETSCRLRNADAEGVQGPNDITLSSTFNTASKCQASAGGVVADGTAKPTYSISRAIEVADKVDIYDGEAYNSYKTNTVSYANYLNFKAAAEAAAGGTDQISLNTIATYNAVKLVQYPYFTDTMKNLTGTSRPQFMTLAPNSITKVRVYIYIEGQDIDNYDFASLGKKISVNFGFTKERYTETDVSYTGPSTDITPAPTEGE